MTSSSVKKSVSGSSRKLRGRMNARRVPTHIRRCLDGKMTIVAAHTLSARGQAVKTRLVNERMTILEQQDEIEERFNSLLNMLKN